MDAAGLMELDPFTSLLNVDGYTQLDREIPATEAGGFQIGDGAMITVIAGMIAGYLRDLIFHNSFLHVGSMRKNNFHRPKVIIAYSRFRVLAPSPERRT